jgi:hypothetical protein
MANNQLTTVNGSGEQTTTQSPQSATQPAATGTLSGSLQPGTASNLLNGQGGVALHGTSLSTVSLSAASPATTASTAAVTPVKHHPIPALYGVSTLLLVIALILFWTTSRSVKITT